MNEPLLTLDEAIRKLRTLNEPVPKPMRLPTKEEVQAAERRLGVRFHPDYYQYLLEASDVVYGTKEPAILTSPGYFTDLFSICEAAWEKYGVPRSLLPICEDNADFYCMNEAGEVLFWSHNGRSSERWANLATWIENVWIGESS
jgi:hypothetical protein